VTLLGTSEIISMRRCSARHHVTTLNTKDESYRLRDKRKPGLLGRRQKPTEEEGTSDATD
jgi:hypothetical protein